jgi:hypothetical protein
MDQENFSEIKDKNIMPEPEASIVNEPQSDQNSSSNLNDKSVIEDNFIEESDDHLPRVQEELDKLNYANESINNLELELEDSKKEYVRTIKDSEEELKELEKKLGSCVEKSRPYYEARIELNEAKEKYYIAKHRFETAQELYVAAKNVQLYAEENLENFSSNTKNDPKEKETLIKILEIAKMKVNDTELSKQSSDIEQINALQIYEEKKKIVEQFEKDLKKNIEKSKKYYELKSNLNKELRFLFTKIEGLKSCLKEAKLAYQQSLNNLELISTEIHAQRQSTLSNRTTNSSSLSDNMTSNLETTTNNPSPSANNNEPTLTNPTKLTSPYSSSNLSSSSSSSTSSSLSISIANNKPNNSSNNNDNTNNEDNATLTNNHNEDFDIYFNNASISQYKNEISIRPNKISDKKIASRNNSQKLSQQLISDEDIQNIGLDIKLKMYKHEIVTKRSTDECVVEATGTAASGVANGQNSSTKTSSSTTPPQSPSYQQKIISNNSQTPQTPSSRPQFRVPTLAFFAKK